MKKEGSYTNRFGSDKDISPLCVLLVWKLIEDTREETAKKAE